MKERHASSQVSHLHSVIRFTYFNSGFLRPYQSRVCAVLLCWTDKQFDMIFFWWKDCGERPVSCLSTTLGLTTGQHDWPKYRSSLKHFHSHAAWHCVWVDFCKWDQNEIQPVDTSLFWHGVKQKHITPFQNFAIFLCPTHFFAFSLFFAESLLVVKSIKLSVRLTEPHHLAAVKAKQTR